MKSFFIFVLFGILPFSVFAQLHLKTFTTKEGTYTRTYHSNKKISTELFHPVREEYANPKGHAKAWNKKGKLIYERKTGRSGLISSVHFSYYANGSISKAEYSSHPDGGIQWHREWTSFDEEGNVTGTLEQNHDDSERIFVQPQQVKSIDTSTVLPKKVNADSLLFYREKTETDPKGQLVTRKKSFPQEGYTITEWVSVGKVIRTKTEFYKKTGIQVIHRTYYSNGVLESEIIIEEKVQHTRRWDTNGKLVEEKYNQPVSG